MNENKNIAPQNKLVVFQGKEAQRIIENFKWIIDNEKEWNL